METTCVCARSSRYERESESVCVWEKDRWIERQSMCVCVLGETERERE